MKEKKRNGVKMAIVILAILLALSLCAVAGIMIYGSVSYGGNTTATVPGNLIDPSEGTQASDPTGGTQESEPTGSAAPPTSTAPVTQTDPPEESTGSTVKPPQATTIRLYDQQPGDNTAFAANNMFPGDCEKQYYCVQIAYQNQVTVHFNAGVRAGYEKLAEVMKVKVTLLSTGEVMYDGLMRDMPDSVTWELSSNTPASTELYYEIAAYLDTSVGNEYQDQGLVADFRWWVEEEENLLPPSKTGDGTNILLGAGTALISGAALICLLIAYKRKEDKNVE